MNDDATQQLVHRTEVRNGLDLLSKETDGLSGEIVYASHVIKGVASTHI